MTLSDKFFSLFKRDALLFFTTLLTGIVIARTLGPEMMGLWAILLLIPGYSEAFGRLQFDVSAVYFIGRKKADIGEITFLLHMVSLLSSIIITCIIVLNFDWLYAQLFKHAAVDVRMFAYAMLLVLPLRLIYLNYSYLFIAHEDVRSYNVFVIIQALTTSGCSIGLILIFDMGIMGALIGSVIGPLVAISYAAVKVHQMGRLRCHLNLTLLWGMAKYAVHHYINGLIGYFQNNITSLIAAIYLVPAHVAFYVLAKSICEIATRMVPVAINTILFPRVSKTDSAEDSRILVARLFRVTLLILMLLAGGLAVAIKAVVYILYGSAYYPIIVPFLIMIGSLVLVKSASVFTSYFAGRGRPDLLPKIAILPLFVQITLTLLLVPQYGVVGAACSFALSAIGLFILQVFFFLKFSELTLTDVLIRFHDLVTVLTFVRGKLAGLTRGVFK